MIEGKINWTGSELPKITAEAVVEKKNRTMISAKVIADSTSYLHKRLTTFVLEYPRYIHSELMTHRVFSKNSASSRAIPFEKFVKLVQDRPVRPLWTQNQAGMQGPIITDPGTISGLDRIWFDARFDAIKHAEQLHRDGVHKQNINRLLEPWMNIKIVLTGTEFTNWFELRDHKDAHPEIAELARMMRFAMEGSTPTFLQPGEWHIPFSDTTVDDNEDVHVLYGKNWKLRCSVARCARVSYNNVDGTNSSPEKDLELFEKLVVSKPLHASPAEHQARVPFPYELAELASRWHYGSSCLEEQEEWTEKRGKYVSNLSGYIQLRKLIECGEFK